MDPKDPSSYAMAKDMLRRTMLARLRGMKSDERAESSLVICREAAALREFRTAQVVGLFAPLATEPDLHPLIEEAWAEKKQVAFPLMIKEGGMGPRLQWHAVNCWEELVVPGPFGLREPDPERCPRIEPKELDLVFVPGVSFDRGGMRLGRGGGFYDRFLSSAPKKIRVVGLMFAGQELLTVAAEPHDQRLPCVLTEEGLQVFARS